MELISLDIEHFGRIGRKRIEFKNGLNVLHGANEVGKSSIARAVRFALLLPSNSNAIDPWIPWSGDGDPTVTLVFRNGADYYRVKKVFGTTTATLESSADCSAWRNLARGRDVDGRLRSLLQWGIPEPGGARGPKGVPESFLASALLADQDGVTDIFEQKLENDAGESGRERISAALQAMAQDPLFKSVLDAAQARVDEAFTTKGQRKRGAADPFKKMTEEVATRQRERDEAENAAISSQALAKEVTELQRGVAEAESDFHEKTLNRRTLEERRARQVALSAAAEARKIGQARVDAVIEAEKRVKTAEEMIRDLEPKIPILRKAEEDAQKTFEAATADSSTALEKRKGELAQEDAAILHEREALRVRQARVDVARDLRTAEEHQEQANRIEETLRVLAADIAALEAVEPWTELQGVNATLHATNQREEKAAKLLAAVAELRRRAGSEWPTPKSHLLPDAQRLANLRKLRHSLELAEGKLDVGLSVEVRGARSAIVSVDGGGNEAKASPFAVEAKQSADIQLDDGVEVSVRGGRAGDREAAERLRKEWQEASDSLFGSVGVADLGSLEEVCRLDSDAKARAESLTRDANTKDAERIALGDPAAEKEQLSRDILELEQRLEGRDLAAIGAAAAAHGANARRVLVEKGAERDSQRTNLATLRAQADTLRARVAAFSDAEPIDDVDAEVGALKQATLGLERRAQKLIDERRVLDAPPETNDSLVEAVTSATKAHSDALANRASAKSDRDSWSARLQERRGSAAGVDIEALTKAEDVARAAASNDGAAVDEAIIASARKAEECAETQYESLVGELRQAEGALIVSGGIAADERLRELDAALQRAHEKQARMEDDYEAWRLLREALHEAERTQATHLGNVLAPDLSERFQAVAGQRYSGVALSPHLGLEGIGAAGDQRELSRLSIGTREQLSTLFRLCLAERLQTALLLDDQLVQSDPDRMRWFRKALRETAGKGTQVVVLTCRPDDYLEPAESPSPHVIDLNSTAAVSRSEEPAA
jgi:hypothetical protein